MENISRTNKVEALADGKNKTQTMNKSPGKQLLFFGNKLYISIADSLCTIPKTPITALKLQLFSIGLCVMKRIITVYKLFILYIFFLCFIASPKLDFKPGYPKRIYKHMWCKSKSVWKSTE